MTEKVFEKSFDEEMSSSHIIAMRNIVMTYITKYPEKNVSVQYQFENGYIEVYSNVLDGRFVCLQINGSPRLVLYREFEEEYFLLADCLIGSHVDLYYPFLESFDFPAYEVTQLLFSVLTDAHENLKGMENEEL
nr:hypothetical protein [Enterococcus sp. 9E7_DIV0242]